MRASLIYAAHSKPSMQRPNIANVCSLHCYLICEEVNDPVIRYNSRHGHHRPMGERVDEQMIACCARW